MLLNKYEGYHEIVHLCQRESEHVNKLIYYARESVPRWAYMTALSIIMGGTIRNDNKKITI